MAEFYGCSFFEMQDRLNAGEDHLWYWWAVSVEGEREGRAIREGLTL